MPSKTSKPGGKGSKEQATPPAPRFDAPVEGSDCSPDQPVSSSKKQPVDPPKLQLDSEPDTPAPSSCSLQSGLTGNGATKSKPVLRTKRPFAELASLTAPLEMMIYSVAIGKDLNAQFNSACKPWSASQRDGGVWALTGVTSTGQIGALLFNSMAAMTEVLKSTQPGCIVKVSIGTPDACDTHSLDSLMGVLSVTPAAVKVIRPALSSGVDLYCGSSLLQTASYLELRAHAMYPPKRTGPPVLFPVVGLAIAPVKMLSEKSPGLVEFWVNGDSSNKATLKIWAPSAAASAQLKIFDINEAVAVQITGVTATESTWEGNRLLDLNINTPHFMFPLAADHPMYEPLKQKAKMARKWAPVPEVIGEYECVFKLDMDEGYNVDDLSNLWVPLFFRTLNGAPIGRAVVRDVDTLNSMFAHVPEKYNKRCTMGEMLDMYKDAAVEMMASQAGVGVVEVAKVVDEGEDEAVNVVASFVPKNL